MHNTTITLEEGQRQLVLMALAHLSLEKPGFDWALNEIAKKLDNIKDGRAETYDAFRNLTTAEIINEDTVERTLNNALKS